MTTLQRLNIADIAKGTTPERAKELEDLAESIFVMVEDYIDEPAGSYGNDYDKIEENVFLEFIEVADWLEIVGEGTSEAYKDIIDAAIDYWYDYLFPED